MPIRATEDQSVIATSRPSRDRLLSVALIMLATMPALLSAQPWALRVTIPNPYPSPYISDWQNSPGIVGIVIDYTGTEPATVHLESRATSPGRGEMASGNSEDMSFPGARSASRDNRDFWSYGNIQYNPTYRDEIVRTGRLPGGSYTLEVKLVTTDGVVLGQQSAQFWILEFSVPELTSPADNAEVRISNPTFQWTPATTQPGFEVRYTLQICESVPERSRASAMEHTPHYRGVIVNSTRYTYSSPNPQLVDGTTYFWRIQARDNRDQPIGDNEGRSPIFAFKFNPPAILELSDRVLTVPHLIGLNGVARAKVRFNAAGRGTVKGRFLVDNEELSRFEHATRSSPDSVLSDLLQTGRPAIGHHRLKVEIQEPATWIDTTSYDVAAGALELDSLVLIPGVAIIRNFSAEPEPGGGENRYRLAGTATMRLPALDNETIPHCTLHKVTFQMDPSSPFNSLVDTAIAGRTVPVTEELFSYAEGFLRVNRVNCRKEGERDNSIVIDANLIVPKVDISLGHIEGLVVTEDGIRGYRPGGVQRITEWGFTFEVRIDNVGKTEDTVWAVLSGQLLVSANGRPEKVTDLTDFRVTSTGKITGRFDIVNPFRFIPGNPYFKLTRCSFYDSLDQYYFKLDCRIESLPYGIDSVYKGGDVSFLVDIDGNTVGKIAPLNEFVPNTRGEGNDVTEFKIPVVDASLDLTYLGVVLSIQNGDLKRDQSRIEMAMDVYFPFKRENGELLPEAERRAVIGEVRNGELKNGGLWIDFNGTFGTSGPLSVVEKKRFDIKDVVRFTLNSLALEFAPEFTLVFNCSLGLNVAGVMGGAQLEDAKIRLSGDCELGAVTGGDFNVLEVFKVSIGTIKWSSKPETLTVHVDSTTEQGGQRVFHRGDLKIECENYFLMENASINIGGGSVASGGFRRLLVYKQTDGSKRMTLTDANLTVCGVASLGADFDYSRSGEGYSLRFAGNVEIREIFTASAVGKVGKQDGQTSFGLFVTADVGHIPVGPGVTLVEVGGGFFWNPEESDIAAVAARSGFGTVGDPLYQRFDAWKPKPNEAPKFAAMLYGAIEFMGDDCLVSGKAMVTVTNRRFQLDARVDVLNVNDDPLAEGMCHLEIGWNPGYAEGTVQVHVDVVSLIKGDAQLDFYAYSRQCWGIYADASLKVLSILKTKGTFFLGNPGFMLDMKFHFGFDIYICDASLDLEGLVWYRRIAPSSWGAYGSVELDVTLFGCGIGGRLEAALIAQHPDYLLYSVGTLKLFLFGATVWKGSVWVSVGSDGFDGGLGRNSRYDRIIDEARNMGREMMEERGQLQQDLANAKAAMWSMSDEQRRSAGLTLVGASQGGFYVNRQNYYDFELRHWGRNMGWPFTTIRDSVIFDDAGMRLSIMRSVLEVEAGVARNAAARVDTVQDTVSARLAEFEGELDSLPSISDIARMSSPLQQRDYQSVRVMRIVGQDTIYTDTTVQTGYDMDYEQADRQQEILAGVRRDNEQCRSQLLAISDTLDRKLVRLDDILYVGSSGSRPASMSDLCELYADGHEKMNDYYWRLGRYLDDNSRNASAKLAFLDRNPRLNQPAYSCSSWVKEALRIRAQALSNEELLTWIRARQTLIHALDTSRHTQDIPDDIADQRLLWLRLGMDLWYYIPRGGFEAIQGVNAALVDTMRSVYARSSAGFQSAWGTYTGSLDRLYERKARLYELLYDVHDQLGRMGEVENAPAMARTYVADAGIRTPMLPRAGNFSGRSTRELARYVTPPTIAAFAGEYVSDETTPIEFGKLSLNWDATHDVGVVDYSYQLGAPDEQCGFRTLGTRQNFWQPFIYRVQPSGPYVFRLRARSAGGFAITRRGTFTAAYYDGMSVPPQRNGVNTADNTRPTRPVVMLDSFIANTREVYARWAASDPQSGIQEYQYCVGTYVTGPPPLYTRLFSPSVLGWTSAGGRTEVNIRGLSLVHGQRYAVQVRAMNGVGRWSLDGGKDFVVDTTPPGKPDIVWFDRYPELGTPARSLIGSWATTRDPESGTKRYLFGVGRRPGEHSIIDTCDWCAPWPYDPNFQYFLMDSREPLREGETLYLTVVAFNGAGLACSDTAPVVVHFDDNTPPAATPPTFTLGKAGGASRYRFDRDPASDPESDVVSYRCRIVRRSDQYVMRDWRDMPEERVKYSAADLSDLTEDEYYRFLVEVTNGAGLTTLLSCDFQYQR